MIDEFSSQLLADASTYATKAGAILLESFKQSDIQAKRKDDNSYVTQADIDADTFIRSRIERDYPHHAIISEELDTNYSSEHEFVWIIDPLDGTTNFSLGLQYWGVSIAILKNGWPEVAALFFPLLGELYTAQSGLGAYVNRQRLPTVPEHIRKQMSYFSTCTRTIKNYDIRIKYKMRVLGSASYNLCSVAMGASVIAFETTPKIWDIAGGWLVIKETGGVVNTLSKTNPFPLKNNTNYAAESYPLIAAASQELLDEGLENIRLRSAKTSS